MSADVDHNCEDSSICPCCPPAVSPLLLAPLPPLPTCRQKTSSSGSGSSSRDDLHSSSRARFTTRHKIKFLVPLFIRSLHPRIQQHPSPKSSYNHTDTSFPSTVKHKKKNTSFTYSERLDRSIDAKRDVPLVGFSFSFGVSPTGQHFQPSTAGFFFVSSAHYIFWVTTNTPTPTQPGAGLANHSSLPEYHLHSALVP